MKNKLVTGKKEKEMLHKELDKERNIQHGYKHNVEKWRKSKVDLEQNIKVFIEKLQDENEELKGSTT